MPNTALIIGVTGQDGTYLAELLTAEGADVFGLVHGDAERTRVVPAGGLPVNVRFIRGDLLEPSTLAAALDICDPDEVYNLGGISSVSRSFIEPVATGDATGLGVTRLLEAIRQHSGSPRFYQASSGEMFGRTNNDMHTESSPLCPQSPYAAAKVYGHHMTINYRESYGLFACSGILFNHESPLRDLAYVTRKITHAVARIRFNLASSLELGDLDTRRDWGFAGDYVRAMRLMLQQPEPDDFVVATGRSHSIREFCDLAFTHVGLDYEQFVRSSSHLLRPSDIADTVGDASKARRVLGWVPTVSFEELVAMMVDADLARQEEALRRCGPPR